MSTKPTVVPTWDSSNTHTTATTGGHQTSGFAANEVPSGAELNYWMMFVAAWCQYLNDYVSTKVDTLIIPSSMAQTQTDSGATSTIPSFHNDGYSIDLKTSSVVPVIYPIPLRAGSTITGWIVYARKNSATGAITAQLWSVASDGITTTPIGSLQSNGSNAPGAIALSQTGMSVAVVAGNQYHIKLQGGGVTGDGAYHAEVTNIKPQ